MPESPGIDFERIRHLARLAKELGLSELTSEENGVKVEITVTPTAPVAMGIPSVGAPPPWGGHSSPAGRYHQPSQIAWEH